MFIILIMKRYFFVTHCLFSWEFFFLLWFIIFLHFYIYKKKKKKKSKTKGVKNGMCFNLTKNTGQSEGVLNALLEFDRWKTRCTVLSINLDAIKNKRVHTFSIDTSLWNSRAKHLFRIHLICIHLALLNPSSSGAQWYVTIKLYRLVLSFNAFWTLPVTF
jgi:hypothetical protein